MKYLTVRNICDEAGVSTGSFYNLFDSKDDLVFYYLQNVFTEYKQQVENDASQHSSLEKIILIYRFTSNACLKLDWSSLPAFTLPTRIKLLIS